MLQDYVRESVSASEPFQKDGLGRRTLLLWGPLLVGFALFPYDQDVGESAFTLSVILAVGTASAVWLVPWERVHHEWNIVPPLLYVLSVVFMREAAGGGLSGYGALYFVPAIWVALFGTRIQVAIMVIAVGAAVAVPPVVTDETTNGEWRRALLTILAAGAMSFAINSLVSALRLERSERDALESRFRRSQALQLNDAVVQDLAVAKYSLDRNDTKQASEALARALQDSKEIVATMIPEGGSLRPGDLARPPRVDGATSSEP